MSLISPCCRDPCLAGTEYIVLENLTSSYNKPCILDLKMGTRQSFKRRFYEDS